MATYYVSTTGSDSNNGTTVSTPWRTIGKAIAAGTTVSGPGDITPADIPGKFFVLNCVKTDPSSSK
jgi:hypothetical protein